MPDKEFEDAQTSEKKPKQTTIKDVEATVGRLTEKIVTLEADKSEMEKKIASLQILLESNQRLNRELSGRMFSQDEDEKKAAEMVAAVRNAKSAGEYEYQVYDKRYIGKDKDGNITTDVGKIIHRYHSEIPYDAENRDQRIRREFGDRFGREWTDQRIKDPLQFVPAGMPIET